MTQKITRHFVKNVSQNFFLTNSIVFFIVLLLTPLSDVSASQKKILTVNNFYGGKTILLQLEPQDEEYGFLEKALLFYDDKGILRKAVYSVGKEKSEESGITRQIEDYDKYGKKLFYEVYYSGKMAEQKGVTHLIEILDEYGNTVLIKYYRDKILMVQTPPEDENRYPFSRLSYITSQYSIFKDKTSGKEHYVIGAYGLMRARSFVRYLNQIKPIDETDKKYLDYWRKIDPLAQTITPLYSSKILVEEDGKNYWILFQDSLIKHLKDNQWLTVYYYIGQVNERMMFIATRFDDKPGDTTTEGNNSY